MLLILLVTTKTHPDKYSELEVAWAVFVSCNQSFLSIIGGGWAYQRKGKNRCSLKFKNAKKNLSEAFSERLSLVSIDNDDALKVLARFDCEDAFHYLDPPYVGTDCGHYEGYKLQDYKQLLEFLKTAKGRWLLSSFPSELLSEYTANNAWYSKHIQKRKSSNNGTKTEVLTSNFPLA